MLCLEHKIQDRLAGKFAPGWLQEVFDRPLLWVLEGMGMIDTNEHTRLGSCFDMRCHGAHPGNAPITSYNLMSFFSDLDQIVFMNPKFKLPVAAP